ncbi:MAG: septal ring lytic transglycosylase RlpA family protein [Nitrosospira sp.]|nr:septal ring lytic transglycosylase RlpA family protein [Nitrosospira sp.]
MLAAGCGSVLKRDTPGKITLPPATSGAEKRGAYYLDDGPGDNPPADMASIPDAVPRDEPLRPANMRPYVALGKTFTPMTALESYRERGIASWYGRRYHGQKTATGEVYDMYGMTAAHPILPLPSYVRVTNIGNGKSVVVRVNDRGPFLSERLIDLSYTAAYKLDVLAGGSAWVEVETILPGTEPPMQVAAAPASSFGHARENESAPLSFAVEQQESGPRPELFEAGYPPEQSDAQISSAVDTASTTAGGIYLQLGAFSAYDNADNFLARLRNEFPSIEVLLGIVAKDGLFKVHAGPYPDHAVARQAADRIAQSLSIKPMLLVR